MTLIGAIKQLHELRSAEDVPLYYKPAIAEVINVLLMDTQEVKLGYWEWAIDDLDDGYGNRNLPHCSVCGRAEPLAAKRNYCGYCGAKMDLPEPLVYPQVEGITPTVVKMDEVEE